MCLVASSLQEPISFNINKALDLVTTVCVNTTWMHLNILDEPGSAADLPTSTAAVGLQQLLVGACVHLVSVK